MVAAPPDSGSPELVERFLALQPRIERVLDAGLPTELRQDLGSVTARQLEALGHVAGGGQTMRQFAQAVGISGAAATALADRMVSQGLVERHQDPHDRRTVWLMPTARALAMLAGYQAWRRQTMSAVLQRLDRGQVTALLDLLGALTDQDPPGEELTGAGGATAREDPVADRVGAVRSAPGTDRPR